MLKKWLDKKQLSRTIIDRYEALEVSPVLSTDSSDQPHVFRPSDPCSMILKSEKILSKAYGLWSEYFTQNLKKWRGVNYMCVLLSFVLVAEINNSKRPCTLQL